MPLPYFSTWKRPTIVLGSTASWKTYTKQVCVVGSPALLKVSLKNRQFSVHLGACLSRLFDQEMGVPQGSVLSVTLFALKINSIVKAISPGVKCSLYMDDFLIVYRSKYIHIIERHLQRSLNMISHWADTNGFKFSSSKTVCMHFCRLRSAHPNPELTLNGTLIPVVEQTKFIGVIFDNKLTFLPHIRYLKEKCEGAEPSACCCSHFLGSWPAHAVTPL